MNLCIHWPSCANHAPIMVYLLKMNSGVAGDHGAFGEHGEHGEHGWLDGASQHQGHMYEFMYSLAQLR